MPVNDEALNRIRQYAQIGSAIAVPIVIAVVGAAVQRAVAEAGLKKDYVQIAISVIREQPDAEQRPLRLWAVAVLNANSPVPLPPELRQQLLERPANIGDQYGLAAGVVPKYLPPEGCLPIYLVDRAKYIMDECMLPDGSIGYRLRPPRPAASGAR